MNRKASVGEILWDNAIYLVLSVIVFVGMLLVIWQQMGGASVWEEYYAKEISKLINMAEPGDEITISVKKATDIAFDNEVFSRSEIFQFDNSKNEVCVKLSKGKKTCYSYFNNVDVTREIKVGVLNDNLMIMKVTSKQ